MRHIVAAFGLVVGLLFLAAQTFTPGTPVHTHTSAAQGGSTLTSPAISSPTLSGTATGTYTLGGTPTLTSPTITTPTITGTTTAAAIAMSDTLSSTKACAAGFTRVGPNFCRVNDIVGTSWVDAIACTGRISGASLPADAKAVLLNLRWIVLSNNAVAARANEVNFFSTSNCAGGTVTARSSYRLHEQVALTAGTILGQMDFYALAPLVETDTFYASQTNAGGNGNADITTFSVVGYFD